MKWTVYIRTYHSYTVMSVDEVVNQILSCCYVAISFTVVRTIPVIGGVELGMDENKEGVGNCDDRFSAERIKKVKRHMINHVL